jgi:L-ascorbate metabolism protein UlaG (beta-lactamase superfamily)
MEIEFVNHSAFVVHHDGIVLMIDPWIEGRVFNNGWELLTKTLFDMKIFLPLLTFGFHTNTLTISSLPILHEFPKNTAKE